MIRMMMHDNRTGDQRFKETMQDFVKDLRRESRHDGRLQSCGGETHDCGNGSGGKPPNELVL
jgi:hypothetical protein